MLKLLFKTSQIIILILLSYFAYSQELKVHDTFQDSDGSLSFLMTADAKTFDVHFGDCYRLFVIVDLNSKDTILKEYLAVNLSPDFPYHFISDYYQANDILVIKGTQCCYLFNSDELSLSQRICPDLSDCAISDGQGTYIRQLKILNDGKSLELNVTDCQDTFRYDISKITDIRIAN